jgi:urease accessory protein
VSDDTTLAAFRLADTALPVGTDSVSYGLEQFIASDRVEDIDDLQALLSTYLTAQLGPGDLVALRAAHAAASDDDSAGVVAADQRLTAVTLSAEFRESAQRTGERLLRLQRDLRSDDLLDEYADALDAGTAAGNYPVVLGAIAGREGVGVRGACLLACHEFVSALLGAAQRLMRLGSTAIQRVLDDLRPVMIEAVEASAGRSLAQMTPFAPLVEISSAAHERADRRLFLS